MEIVIKIPDDVYTRLFDNGIQDNEIAVDDICEMARAIRLGTPLEAQPCEDCISREAVLGHICEDKECYKEECKGRTLKRCPDLQWVFDLPSVTPQQPAWIPVSERLPEVNGSYLTTIKGIGYYNRIRSFANSLHKIDKYDFSSKKAGWYFYDSECGYIEETDVIAWMPLPKPYTESEDEE